VLTTEPKIIEGYVRDGRVKLVFRDVLNHGFRSAQSHEAAACAGRQEKFWHLHAVLFEKQSALWGAFNDEAIVAAMREMAGGIDGFDLAAWDACMNSDETVAATGAGDAEQRTRGINAQPIFEIIGPTEARRMYGAQPFAQFGELIEAVQKGS
jgi:protein-disulfide isomerase